MIIAVTGYIAAGKDVLCEELVNNGYKHLSLSDLLRERLRKENKPTTRNNLVELGNSLREEHGDEILAKLALKRIDSSNWVLSSVGRVAEAKELAKHTACTLVFVTANQDVRYQRLKTRNRLGDISTYEEFLAQEKKEAKGGERMYREFELLKQEADIILENNGTLEEFTKQILHHLLN
ncbi:MAG: AAA family ATPase [Candidatus Woesearchaeota archaeon]